MSIISEKQRCVNIVLIEYINRNLGDTAIAECTSHILREALNEVGFHNYRIHEYNMYTQDMEYIRKADLIIFAGGGLVKFKRERFHEYLPEIIEEAERNQIAVFLNCVGVEGYDSEDERCLRLKKSLNSSCIKGITVRDDYETLIKLYLGKDKEWTASVFDPVAFGARVYDCKKVKKTNTIGLGIAEDSLYANYGYPSVSKQFQLNFWKEVIQELEAQGYDWQIFGNGLYQDRQFELEVLEFVGKIGEKEKYLAERPTEVEELAEQIANYKGVIATRLHANIISYAMKVPSIGLVWNDKMLFWGEKIGYPERFLKMDSCSPIETVEMLNKAIKEGINAEIVGELEKVKRPLREFVMKYGTLAIQNKRVIMEEVFPWEEKMVASALGGMKFQYNKMNSSVTFLDKYRDGFKWFEADIKLTADKKLVCVNGWTKDTFKKLDYGYRETDCMGITYKEFMSQKYYHHYRTIDYEMLMNLIQEFSDVNIVLDARNNSLEVMEETVEIIHENLLHNPNMKNKFIIRVSSLDNVQCIYGLKDRVSIMYDVQSENLENQDGLNLIFSDSRIQYFSFAKKTLKSEMISLAKQYNKQTCVYTCNSLMELKEFLTIGVDLVETEYLSVNNLKQLA